MSASGLFDLSGRVAVVTGASRGIGRSLAQGLAEVGARVALVSRSHDELRECADAVLAGGGKAEVFPADLARMSDLPALLREILAVMGQVDILVNSAGLTRSKPSVEISQQDWDDVFDVNVKSVFFLSQAVGRYWIDTKRFAPENQRGKGKIINLASIGSSVARGNIAPYIASKHAVLGVTRILAVEWAAEGICVNSLAPGYTQTPLTQPLFDRPAFNAWLERRVPMGQRAYPADMVGTAVFLAAPASDYLTGQMITVDGGFLAGWELPPPE